MRPTRWRQFPRVSWGSLPGHRGSQMDHRTQKYKFSLQFWELSDSCFYSLSYFEATKGYFLVTLGLPRWHRGEESSRVGRRIHKMWVQSLGRERSPGVGNDNPLQDSCLEVSKDRVAWQITVHGATELNTIEHTYTHDLMNESWNVTKCALHQWKWPQTLIVSFAKKFGCQQIFSNVVKFLPLCAHLQTVRISQFGGSIFSISSVLPQTDYGFLIVNDLAIFIKRLFSLSFNIIHLAFHRSLG